MVCVLLGSFLALLSFPVCVFFFVCFCMQAAHVKDIPLLLLRFHTPVAVSHSKCYFPA